MKLTTAFLAVACALTLAATGAFAQGSGTKGSEPKGSEPKGSDTKTPSAAVEKPKIVALLFYADWCGSCKELDPKLSAVKKDFAGKPVLFSRLDLTNEFTKHQSKLQCSLMGMDKIFAEHAAKTGFVLLIDADSKRVLGTVTKAHSEADIRAAIAKYVKS